MRALVLALLLASVGSVARAQDFDAAGKHFAAAQDAFAKQHFKVAAGEFQAAFDITHDPILLYNVGESWEKAGDGKKAVAGYRAYLKAQPNAGDKAEVQRRIKAIEAKKYQLASQSAPGDEPAPSTETPAGATTPSPAAPSLPPSSATGATPPGATTAAPATGATATTPATPATGATAATPATAPTAATPPTPPPATTATENQPPPAPAAAAPPVAQIESTPPPALAPAPSEKPMTRLRVAAWIGVATTVAALTAGAILGLAAQARADEIDRRYSFVDANGQPKTFSASEQSDIANLKSDGNLYNGLAIGFFSASAALAVATTVMFVVDWKRNQEPRPTALRLAPTVDKTGAGLAAAWSF